MKFEKKSLFSLLLGLELLGNIMQLAHINFLYTTTLVSFCACILLPGFLISLILRIRKISFWENLVFIVGLSIAFLELGGLLLNILLPLFGMKNPLAFQNIVFGFDIYALVLFIFAWIRTKPFVIQIPGQSDLAAESRPATHLRPSQFVRPSIVQIPGQSDLAVGSRPITHLRPSQFVRPSIIGAHSKALENLDTVTSIQIQLPEYSNDVHSKMLENLDTVTSIQIQLLKRSITEKVLYALPVFFPILAILGAIILNNGGSNILTLTLLGAMACYSLLLVLFRAKVGVNLYPYAIFFIGMASLFTTSLRSWYATGHDIEREFYVFKLTNSHHFWNMAFYPDPYSACLSITILPTILTNLLSIQDMYVYKVIFQILFATSPVLVFFIMRKYTTPVFSFLSAFFFMSFPPFYNDMPMLNRQEIGFIFFGLVLYMLLLSELSLSMRRILFIIFALSVIVSHYSTNFVLLELIGVVYVLTLIISLPFVKNIFGWLLSISHVRQKNTFSNKAFLTLPLVVLLVLMTYFWNSVYTNSSQHTSSVIVKVVSSIFVKSNNDAKSGDVFYTLFSSTKPDPQKDLEAYIQSATQSAESINSAKVNNNQFYNPAITGKYPTYPFQQEKLAPTPLGNLLASFHIPVFDIQAQLRTLSASSLQIFVFIGLLALLFFKNKKPLDVQYLLLCLSAVIILILTTALPVLSMQYGLLRMFQQFLFILSMPIVIGISSILFFMKEQKKTLFTGIIAIIFFLNLTGFFSHLTGNYYPQMNLENSGAYYDAYYIHKSDVLAIEWLSKNNSQNEPVEADVPNKNKLLAYGGIYALNEFFPSIMRKNAYVYLELSSDRVVLIDKNVLIYNSPKYFLDDNKDMIYSNGRNGIYK